MAELSGSESLERMPGARTEGRRELAKSALLRPPEEELRRGRAGTHLSRVEEGWDEEHGCDNGTGNITGVDMRKTARVGKWDVLGLGFDMIKESLHW